MKKLFGIMFAGYVALLNAVAYAQQGMTQEMADNLNARNEDQSAFMIIWFMILENWLLILAVLVLLSVVLLMMRRHDRMKAALAAAESTGSADGDNTAAEKPAEDKEEK